jgi:hypothetical protein
MLPEGKQKVSVMIMGADGGCTIHDTVEVNVEPGRNMYIEVNGEFVAFRDPRVVVEVGNGTDLKMEVGDPAGISFQWTVISTFEVPASQYPVSNRFTQETRTTALDKPMMEQRIAAQITDARGCITRDTVTLRTEGAFALDSVVATDVFFRPGGRDTVYPFPKTYYPNGELELCSNGMLFLHPFATGTGLRYRWTINQSVAIYDEDAEFIQNSPAPTSYYETTEPILGFRPLTNAKTITFLITVLNETSEASATITVHIRPAPYVKMITAPLMYKDAYYFNQAIYYNLTPARYKNYDFYRFIKNEKTFYEYELVPSRELGNPHFAPGANNPQRGISPVYATAYIAGEDSNMVVGIVEDFDGCRNMDTVKLKLIPLPNVVIPDDPFFVLNRVFLPDFDIEVWDTWGLKIKDYGSKGWDATYRGKKVRSGTYYYNAKIPTPGGFEIITGAVTVLRDNDDE